MAEDRIRFHLDEHISPAIAAALRRHGVDVTTTLEMGMRSADDEAHLKFARDQRRVIVTDDADFLRLARSNVDHCGIVFCYRDRHSFGQIIRCLILIFELYSPTEMHGAVEYVFDA